MTKKSSYSPLRILGILIPVALAAGIPVVLDGCSNGMQSGLSSRNSRTNDSPEDEESTAPPPPASYDEDAGPKPEAPHDRFASSKSCANCHQAIFAQWSKSMHSRALTSPITLAQANQVAAGPLANAAKPDPGGICVNCHAPSAAAVTNNVTLPLPAAAKGEDGVSCVGCHQFDGNPTSGGGGLTVYQKGFATSAQYFGPLKDPVANSAHQSAPGEAFKQRNLTCANCHNVNLDRDHDGKVVKGEDLVLQETFDEYSAYRDLGGKETCTTCHMPVMQGATRAAEPFATPDRVVHDHSFVGVDYALDDPAQEAAQTSAREALLKSAGKVEVDRTSINKNGGNITFGVTIENTSSGHNLPTGFAFARQMWLEVVVTSGATTLFQSGVLANPTDDLCDGNTLDETDNPMKKFIVGCARSDDSLVNIQTKLVDRVTLLRDANGNRVIGADGKTVAVQDDRGKETFLQFLTGGGVARTRPVDKVALGTLRPFEKKSFAYRVTNPGQPVTIAVKLMFRHLPPYLVRALAAGQPATESPQLTPLVSKIRPVQMGADTTQVN